MDSTYIHATLLDAHFQSQRWNPDISSLTSRADGQLWASGGGSIVRKKGSSASFFGQRRKNDLANLCGLGAETAGPSILLGHKSQIFFDQHVNCSPIFNLKYSICIVVVISHFCNAGAGFWLGGGVAGSYTRFVLYIFKEDLSI